jgi:hypothetical protein
MIVSNLSIAVLLVQGLKFKVQNSEFGVGSIKRTL